MYYLMFALLLTGCAFKGDDPIASANTITAQASRMASVTWGEGGTPLSRAVVGSKNFSIPDPVSVPVEIPDQIHLVFNSPLVSGKLLEEPRVFITDATDESKAPPPVRLSGVLEPSGIEISGLKTFFSVNKQQKGVLRISLMNAVTGDEEASLGLTLITTPTAVEITMIERNVVREPGLRKLQAPQARLDLLIAFKIKNPNPFRTEFTFPGELKGSIRKDFIRHDYSPQQCHTDVSEAHWTESYPTRFFALPIDEDVGNNWISLSTQPERSVTLAPGKSRILGIYASGERVAAFIEGGVPNSTHGSVHVIVGCDRSCDGLLARDPGEGGGSHGSPPCHTSAQYGEVPTGIDSHGAYWLLEGGSIQLNARNAFLGRADDPASRAIQFLPVQNPVF